MSALESSRTQRRAVNAEALAREAAGDEARGILDKLLETKAPALPISGRNLALALRMKLARTFDEFLKYAPRKTSALTLNMDGNDLPDPPESCVYGNAAQIATCREKSKPRVRFDSDAARIFTEKLPVEYWLKAAESPILPQRQRKEIALAAWVRAVLLDDEAHGRRAATRLETVAPDLKDGLHKYEEASTRDERRYAAALLLLARPEMVPELRAGSGREVDPGKIDPYGNNWWCAQGEQGSDEDYTVRYYQFYNRQTPPLVEIYGQEWNAAFLTDEERKTAQRESKALSALAAAPSWLSAQAIAFATAHPEDPRGPEGLHQAVRATRHGCADDATGHYSRQAFQLRHRKYPNSEWTKKKAVLVQLSARDSKPALLVFCTDRWNRYRSGESALGCPG